MSVREHDDEPVRGLPAPLPPGEAMLWQGAPEWRTLARTAFHTRTVALYFAVLIVLAAAGVALGQATMTGLIATIAAAGLGLGLLHLLAWATARSTVYTLTSRRIVIRSGVALPTCINLPFSMIGTARIALRPDGTGDLPLALAGGGKLAYTHLWPHARPWKIRQPEPMLRALPDAARVGAAVADAMARALPGGRRLAVSVPAGEAAAPALGGLAA